MQYNLSFWDEPNWKKESSIDPVFLISACAVALAVTAFGVWNWRAGINRSLESELNGLNAENAKLTPAYEKITAKQEELKKWEDILLEFKAIEEQRIVWSQQLQAIQGAIPETMILNKILIDAKSIIKKPKDPKKAKLGAESVKSLYTLTLTGSCKEDVDLREAKQLILSFVEYLPKASGLENYISKAEYDSSSSGRSFQINCDYYPVNWTLKPAEKKNEKTQ